MVCSQSCHIYPHTRSHFYTFRFALVTDVESRPPDDDVVGNKIARRTAFIHRAAYLRHIFGVLWRYVSYTFRIRFATAGETTEIKVRSPWPHPSFQGRCFRPLMKLRTRASPRCGACVIGALVSESWHAAHVAEAFHGVCRRRGSVPSRYAL